MHQPLRFALLAAAVLTGSYGWAQCHYIPATSTSGDTVTFSTAGGSFASYGCAPVDPTYWMSGNGMSITATFTQTVDHPAIRVWGMNDDDFASVTVNGLAYPLDNASASLSPKVVCGLSPGPDGVTFVAGQVAGANDNIEGNYSYQDVHLNVANVNTVTVTGTAGAGWGFAGVSVECPGAIHEQSAASVTLYPNPTDGQLLLPQLNGVTEVRITDAMGCLVMRSTGPIRALDLSSLAPGSYTVVLFQGAQRSIGRVVKL